jgi:predicted nucleotidyltransferase
MSQLQTTIANYFLNRKEIVAIYLFGSQATGRQRPFSDVDVGVILQHAELDNASELHGKYTMALGRLLRKDVHIVILNTAGEVLLKQVFTKGGCIHVNDAKALRHFKMKSYAMIADFGFLLDKLQTGFRNQIMKERLNG